MKVSAAAIATPAPTLAPAQRASGVVLAALLLFSLFSIATAHDALGQRLLRTRCFSYEFLPICPCRGPIAGADRRVKVRYAFCHGLSGCV